MHPTARRMVSGCGSEAAVFFCFCVIFLHFVFWFLLLIVVSIFFFGGS